MDEQNDESLIAGFRSGDMNAFKKLYRQLYNLIFFLIIKIIDDREAAKDIAQDTFLKLYLGRSGFYNMGSIVNFLKIVARNASLKHLEKSSRTTGIDPGSYSEVLAETAEIKSELLPVIEKMIDELPAERRKIFKMIYQEGKKSSEIAADLKITESTVRNQKKLALDYLRKRLQEIGYILLIIIYNAG